MPAPARGVERPRGANANTPSLCPPRAGRGEAQHNRRRRGRRGGGAERACEPVCACAVQPRAGEGLRQRRGAVAVCVMLAAVAAVVLLAGTRAGPPGHVSLSAMTQADADHMFRNAKPMRCPALAPGLCFWHSHTAALRAAVRCPCSRHARLPTRPRTPQRLP